MAFTAERKLVGEIGGASAGRLYRGGGAGGMF